MEQLSPILLYILVATSAMGLISLVGTITLLFNKKLLKDILIFLVALAAGTMLGTAFFHLIPESSSTIGIYSTNVIVIGAFVAFFILERTLHWHHHHEINDKHTIGTINLVADAFHNFLDGLIIAAAFYTDPSLGVLTTFAVILHEIPQEIGDFGVMLHSGMSIKKAILSNFVVSLLSIIGGIIGFLYIDITTSATAYITAFAAGGFLYLSTSDLLPEMKQENNKPKAWITIAIFIAGTLLMILVK